MRIIAVLCAALGMYILWGFDMSASLTGWSALRLIGGLLLIAVGYYSWKRYRETAQGFHQWPDGKGPLYDEWLRIPADKTTLDYHVWLAEKKDWKEPWATWAESTGAKRPTLSEYVERAYSELDQKINAKVPSPRLSRDQIADRGQQEIIANLNRRTLAEEAQKAHKPMTLYEKSKLTQQQIIRNLQETTLAEEEARQKAQRLRKRFHQAAAQARERLRKKKPDSSTPSS